MGEDPVTDLLIRDEGDDPHLRAAPGARELIALDDAPQQVRPAAAGLLAGPIGRR